MAELKWIIQNTEKSYENLVIREVVKEAFFKMTTIREDYWLSCAGAGMRRDLAALYLRAQLLLMVPITPHLCESIWQKSKAALFQQGDKDLIINCSFPQAKLSSEDLIVLSQKDYLDMVGRSLRSTVEKFTKKSPNKKIKAIYIVTTN